MKRIMVDMSATLLHHGHIRLLKQAKAMGQVVVGLTSDEEILKKKGYTPELSYAQRKEILLALSCVDEVVETPWLITENVLDEYKIDTLIHGEDNANPINESRLKLLPRTEGVSSSTIRERVVHAICQQTNHKTLLTPGPAAILPQHYHGLKPAFGRGDAEYDEIRQQVTNWLLKLSGQNELVISQGSASFMIEAGLKSFVKGSVLLVQTGYYSERMQTMLSHSDVETVTYDELNSIEGKYDWIVACYTETSTGFKSDIKKIKHKAEQLKAKLFIDATASIGLEDHHDEADVVCFSSCKGLFGLTGAAFIAFKNSLKPEITHNETIFYSNLSIHQQQQVTGPYHAICSLHEIMTHHDMYKDRVKQSKVLTLKTWGHCIENENNQPLLCTYLHATLEKIDPSIITYQPRSNLSGSIVCHLGELHKSEPEIDKLIGIKPL